MVSILKVTARLAVAYATAGLSWSVSLMPLKTTVKMLTDFENGSVKRISIIPQCEQLIMRGDPPGMLEARLMSINSASGYPVAPIVAKSSRKIGGTCSIPDAARGSARTARVLISPSRERGQRRAARRKIGVAGRLLALG
jgi:hypothetical protein